MARTPIKTPLQIYNAFTASLYEWANTTQRQPTPGAEAWSFTKQMLPLIDFIGPGEMVQNQFQIYTQPLYVTKQARVQGIPGIAAASVVSQALMMNSQGGG